MTCSAIWEWMCQPMKQSPLLKKPFLRSHLVSICARQTLSLIDFVTQVWVGNACLWHLPPTSWKLELWRTMFVHPRPPQTFVVLLMNWLKQGKFMPTCRPHNESSHFFVSVLDVKYSFILSLM